VVLKQGARKMVRPLPNWRSFFAERVALVSTMVVAAVLS
jgi:hypothetical protein